jgi:hypothetical protein
MVAFREHVLDYREHVAFRNSRRSKPGVVPKVAEVPKYSNEYIGRSPSYTND